MGGTDDHVARETHRFLPCKYRSMVYPLLFSRKMIGLRPLRIMTESSWTVSWLRDIYQYNILPSTKINQAYRLPSPMNKMVLPSPMSRAASAAPSVLPNW